MAPGHQRSLGGLGPAAPAGAAQLWEAGMLKLQVGVIGREAAQVSAAGKAYSGQGFVVGQSHSASDLSTFLWMEWDFPKAGVQFQLFMGNTLGGLLVHGRASLFVGMQTRDFNSF